CWQDVAEERAQPHPRGRARGRRSHRLSRPVPRRVACAQSHSRREEPLRLLVRRRRRQGPHGVLVRHPA
ncbi:hypothetical protein BN1723_020848, partial [Verticillium longisporum]